MTPRTRRNFLLLIALIVAISLIGFVGIQILRSRSTSVSRTGRLLSFLGNPQDHTDWMIPAGSRCGTAPFIFPTDGYIGFIWDDSFRPGHRHQGIDIFGGQDPNTTPVVAAYPGYLSRLDDWKSTVIIRIPSDPLQPDRQIWTYYTHMADRRGNSFINADFPPGTHDLFVEAGTLLGYQGNYSGTPGNPTGIHLHFSVVMDDGQGKFLNELEIANTYDPSPYLGLELNANSGITNIPLCATN
ncbi:MAG TPA: M23 family metallopeptidase [Anaerolineales bacterium]|nr:M23 family metallopeptidase [Anaerolineales bacterium]